MHIHGLPDFTLAQIKEYISEHSAFLPVLAKIKIPEEVERDKTIRETIETNLKNFSVELAYLRLCEGAINEKTKKVLEELAKDSKNTLLQDQRTALNLQHSLILSLNEKLTVEILEYCYFNIITAYSDRTNTQDVKEVAEISKLMHGHTLKGVGDLKERGEDFGKFLDKVKNFILNKHFQSQGFELPKDENLFLVGYLKDRQKDLKQNAENAAHGHLTLEPGPKSGGSKA